MVVRRLFRTLERALRARRLVDDPGHPTYLALVEKLRSTLHLAMRAAPAGLSVTVDGGAVRWKGRVVLGGAEASEVCLALQRHGVAGLRFVTSATWGDLARFVEGLGGQDFAGGPRVGPVGIEDLSFLSVEGPDRGTRDRASTGEAPQRAAKPGGTAPTISKGR